MRASFSFAAAAHLNVPLNIGKRSDGLCIERLSLRSSLMQPTSLAASD